MLAESLRQDHRANGAAPIVAFGDESVLRIPPHAAAQRVRRVLLVCGRRSFEASGAARMLPSLEKVAEVRRWSEFAPNTDAADLRSGLVVMGEYEPDLVVGVGGGSAMDMAKLLCAFHPTPDAAVLARIRAGKAVEHRSQRLFLAPTTSGSGAEATHFAVVYIGHEKFSIGGAGMRPDGIFLDPRLSLSGTAYQRATSGIDAVCQAIESLWATGANQRSRHYARIALRMLMACIVRFVNDPDSESARAMSIGSHFAGRAIDISRTTAPHALSYALTKQYGVSHGHAVALTLGMFLARHASATHQELNPQVDHAEHERAMAYILEQLHAVDAAAAQRRFRDLLDSVGLETRLRDVGVASQDDRRALAAAVNAERLGNNPIAFTHAALSDLLAEIE